MYGAVIGGLTVGVLDNLAAVYVSAGYRDTFVFSFTILVLLIRLRGCSVYARSSGSEGAVHV
ncbi:hypothetical protein [Streptomyces sp. F001]|uniref:hypothetical protein n=1 Tax=Streptomyces sp. F001 TaxID=1510026 RepID=UPI001F0EB43F|nr:hypothetical protein [Streptomyces sp. F001]